MKPIYNFLLLLLGLLAAQSTSAQTVPQGMRYQAVARDLAGNPLQNRSISLLIGIRSGAPRGELVYQEMHRANTDNGGQFAITIGAGRPTQGTFESIPWSSAEMWLTVAFDADGGENFKELTASQLWAVPYAFHAGTAESFSGMGSTTDLSKSCGSTGIPFWTNLGNYNVSDTCHFIGTIHAVDFITKTNSIERMRVTKDGKILIQGLLEVKDLHVLNDAAIDHNLDVGNDAAVAQNLTVDKDAHIGQNLTVDQNAHVIQDLAVDHNATVGHDLTVSNNGHVAQTLTVDKTLTANTRVVVNGAVSGSDQSIDNYPLLVQGSDQGIAVKVNGSRSSANNFVSFWDDAGGMQGRIEGQTASELHNSFDYIWYQTMNSLNSAFSAAIIIADIAGVDDADAAAVEGAQLGLIIAEWAKVDVELDNNVGVAFESGSGDYAEWLEKAAPAESFRFGEVVGVRGGKISKNTRSADHLMVVSKDPIVLGNMPPAGRQQDFEKIAFMGQVPVRVVGKVAAGDYLLASGRNDGQAIAVNPAAMRAADYDRIVGVAWAASDNPLGGMVNTAVGINANDVSKRLSQQQNELEAMKQQINQLYAKLGLPAPNTVGEPVVANQDNPATAPARANTLTKAQMDDWLERNRSFFENWMSKAQTKLEQQGIDVQKYPEIAAIYADPIQYLKSQNALGYLDGTK